MTRNFSRNHHIGHTKPIVRNYFTNFFTIRILSYNTRKANTPSICWAN